MKYVRKFKTCSLDPRLLAASQDTLTAGYCSRKDFSDAKKQGLERVQQTKLAPKKPVSSKQKQKQKQKKQKTVVQTRIKISSL